MTEKLTINLTEGDVKVEKEFTVVEYLATCPLCNVPIKLTRLNQARCDCNITWMAEVKIKGTRSLDDEDKFQMPMFQYQSHDGMKEVPDDREDEAR